MRSDAKQNYDHLLSVARSVMKHGADASLRDVARKAEVGLGTLYRHFPTRDALLEALLREGFDELKAKAIELETSRQPGEALVSWLRDVVRCGNEYRGAIASMVAAIEDKKSALHASCVTMKAAGARLLVRAQQTGVARRDLDGAELFAIVGAMTWIGDQPSLASRADHLFEIISRAILA